MKKILYVTILLIVFLNNKMYAQSYSDAFFNAAYEESREINATGSSLTPKIPVYHELEENQSAIDLPIGSGIMILSCLGIGYMTLKKNRSN